MTAPSGINIPVPVDERPTTLAEFEIVGAIATALGHRWSSVPSSIWFGQLITSGLANPSGDPGHPQFYLHLEDNALWFHTEGGRWITVAGSGGGITLTQANAAITAAVHAWARDNDTKIPDGKLPDGIARDAEVTAAIAAGIAGWAATGNADPIPETKVPSSIARDSEVQAAIAAAITGHGTGGGLTANEVNALIADWAEAANTATIPAAKLPTIPEANIPAAIARDSEVTTAIAAAILDWAKAGNTATIPVAKLPTIPDNKIPAGIARDSEVTAAIQQWARAGDTTHLPDAKIPVGIARDSEVSAAVTGALTTIRGGVQSGRDTLAKLSTAIDALTTSGGSGLEAAEIGTFTFTSETVPSNGQWARRGARSFRLGISDVEFLYRLDATLDDLARIWIDDTRVNVTFSLRRTGYLDVTFGADTMNPSSWNLPSSGSISLYFDHHVPEASQITLATSTFDGNLSSSVNTLQKLAQAVDDLVVTGGTTPTPQQENIWHGLVAGTVDTETEIAAVVSSLTAEQAPVGGHIVTLGPAASNGQRWVLIVPADHDIVSLINQAVGDDEKGSFTRIVWSTQISGESVISYHSGALRAGALINYRLTLGA